MANYILNQTANFDTANAWSTVDATSLLDSEAGNTAMTTSFVESSGSTTGIITVDGIAVKIAARTASPSGTFSVHLAIAGVEVVGSLVTINATDVHVGSSTANGGCGWFFFKFSAPLTLLAATSYTVGAKCSVAGEITLYRNGTAGNWSRQLRTTTTSAAPSTNDAWFNLGQCTGAGANNTYTLTYNQTATTSFGLLQVGKYGIFSSELTSSTAYYLKLAGILRVTGGTLNMATAAGRMPTSSSFILEFNCSSNVQYGLEVLNGSTWNGGGASKTRWTKMTADKSAAATVIALLDTTGWANSDLLGFASTSTTRTETEQKTASTIDSSTQVTLSAGLTNAHSGTNTTYDTRCEVANLTSNVKIRGISTSFNAYVFIDATATVNIDNVEIYQVGSSTANKLGVDIQTTTGSCTINNCAIHDMITSLSSSVNISGASANNFTLTNNAIYQTGNHGISIAATTGSSWTLTGNLVLGALGLGYNLVDMGGLFQNNVAAGGANAGIAPNDNGGTMGANWTGNVSHSNASYGINMSAFATSSGWSFRSWRNNDRGLAWNVLSGIHSGTIIAFGNNSAGFSVLNYFFGTLILTATFDRGPSSGLQVSGQSLNGDRDDEVTYVNSVFGGNDAHTTADINILGQSYARVVLKNCKLNSSTPVAGQTLINSARSNNSGIFSDDNGQVSGAIKMWTQYGTITRDSSIQDSSHDTLRMTPNNATNKIRSIIWVPNVNSATTPTVSVSVRCSVVGDGTAYNGNRPRLMLMADPCMGYGTSDTVLATATAAANGAFEVLSAALPASASRNGVAKVYCDLDGTQGWCNIKTTPTLS